MKTKQIIAIKLLAYAKPNVEYITAGWHKKYCNSLTYKYFLDVFRIMITEGYIESKVYGDGRAKGTYSCFKIIDKAKLLDVCLGLTR